MSWAVHIRWPKDWSFNIRAVLRQAPEEGLHASRGLCPSFTHNETIHAGYLP